MSSPAEGSGSGTEKPQGFSRFMRRASKALRPRSQRLPNEPIEPATESRTVSVPRPSPSSRPAPPTERSVNDANSYMKLREEKARALFAKYGMTLESTEWTRPTLPTGSSMGQQQPAEWIEKRIVMRVHRQCHRCQTTFSADKICPNCNHTRCKKCPRFPMKRPKDQRPGGEKFDAMAPGALVVDPGYKGKGKLVPLTKPRGEGKADHVRKHPVHRVRRTCHRCDALFVGKATLCTGCGHQRCPTCPRDPPKSKKWPTGYPGDVQETFPLAQRVPKQIRTRFRWECCSCDKPFIEHEKSCRGCQHERCDTCPRKPPKKVRRRDDPEVVKSVEERMAAMGLGAGSAA